MKLGIYTNAAELQKTRPWVYTPKGYTYEPDEQKVIFHLRPWTRTTQGVVEKRAKAKNIAIMDADVALKGVGVGDKKSEAYTRELADFLIADWEGIVFATDFVDVSDTGEIVARYSAGDPMPCESRFKTFLFEDVTVAVDIVQAAQSFATVQIGEEAKNSARSSGGAESHGNSQNPASA